MGKKKAAIGIRERRDATERWFAMPCGQEWTRTPDERTICSSDTLNRGGLLFLYCVLVNLNILLRRF